MSQDVSSDFSRKIVNMSLLCALFVVSMHCNFGDIQKPAVWIANKLFQNGISRIAVPFFFVASGYFLSRHIGEEDWWRREIAKRVKTIVLPFAIWALLYQILVAPLCVIANIMAGRPLTANIALLNADWLSVFGLQWDAWPATVPLWFLRALFILVVFSPLIIYLLRKMPRTFLFVLFLGSVLMQYAPDPELGGLSGFFATYAQAIKHIVFRSRNIHQDG